MGDETNVIIGNSSLKQDSLVRAVNPKVKNFKLALHFSLAILFHSKLKHLYYESKRKPLVMGDYETHLLMLDNGRVMAV